MLKKLLKIIAWLAGGALLAAIALTVTAALFFDPNDFKQHITRVVQEKTGRELTVQGPLKLTVFPWLGVQLNQVTLGNAPGFGAAPFASVDTARLRAKLLPLLRREVELDTVTLRGMTLNLSKNKSGQTNWGDLISESGGKRGPARLGALAIGGVEIDDAKIIWNDQAGGKSYTLDNFSLHSGALASNRPFDVAMKFDARANNPRLDARAELRGTGKFDPDAQRLEFKPLHIELAPRGKPAVQLDTQLSADLQHQTLTLADLKLESLGMTVSGELRGTKIIDAPSFSGPLRIAPFNPRDVFKQLGAAPPQSADGAALTRAAATFNLDAASQQLRLTKLAAKLDDTSITGNLTLKNFARPVTNFALALDDVDVDRYLPPREEPQRSAGFISSANAAQTNAPPPATLRAFNAQGVLRIGKLKVANLRATDVQATLNAANGVIKLHPLNANLYGGTYQGNVGLDARGDALQLTLDEKLNGVQAGPLLRDLAGKERLTGKATLSAKLAARGADGDALLRTLGGNAAFSFTDGAVKGVNIAKLVRDAQARLQGQAPARDDAPNQTDFSELRGTAVITGGILHNEDLTAKSPLLRVTGKGDVNLVDRTMDYVLGVALVNTLTGQSGKELTELRDVTIPVKVSGPLADLSYRPDVEGLLRGRVEAEVEKKREEVEQRLQEQLQEKLKGLFQ